MSTSGASRSGSAAITGTFQGTAAARPAAASAPPGAVYWATDTNEISVNNAGQTAWQTINTITPTGHNLSIAGNSSISNSGGTSNLSGGVTELYTINGAPAYSASITPNALTGGTWQTITVTNATAFTINAPTNPPIATGTQPLTIEILNSSGGVMGAITWNGVFKLVGGAFTNPANTFHRFIRFEWNGANWIETSRASADY